MASYLVLHPTYCRDGDKLYDEMHQPGAVIDYRGEPGRSLLPLDAEARSARLAFLRKRSRDARERDERNIAGFRDRLSQQTMLAQFDQAQAEFAAFVKAAEADEVSKRGRR